MPPSDHLLQIELCALLIAIEAVAESSAGLQDDARQPDVHGMLVPAGGPNVRRHKHCQVLHCPGLGTGAEFVMSEEMLSEQKRIGNTVHRDLRMSLSRDAAASSQTGAGRPGSENHPTALSHSALTQQR